MPVKIHLNREVEPVKLSFLLYSYHKYIRLLYTYIYVYASIWWSISRGKIFTRFTRYASHMRALLDRFALVSFFYGQGLKNFDQDPAAGCNADNWINLNSARARYGQRKSILVSLERYASRRTWSGSYVHIKSTFWNSSTENDQTATFNYNFFFTNFEQ